MFVQEQLCNRCGRWLPEEAFNRYRDRRQWWCRECFRTYFRDRGDRHREQVEAAKHVRRAVAREFVLGYLREHPCVSCGESDPIVLEFDHTGLKGGCVGQMIADAAKLERIQAEISLCEVVCANCHRHRTFARRPGGARGAPPPPGVVRPRIRQRNLDWVYGVLEESECVDCGLADMTVLEFDHVGPKREAVLVLAWTGYSLDSIKREIEQCEVRCANCHRRKTAAERGQYRHEACASEEAGPILGAGPLA